MASIVSGTDPENNEQMKEAVKETEKKVAKILKLVRNNGPDKKGKIPEDSKKKSELIFLIEDVHKQYRSLYAQYDHLREEMIKKKTRSRKENESPSSASSSDSEYYSPRENEEGLFLNDQKAAFDNKPDVETPNPEASLHIRHKGSSKTPGKEALNPESMADGINKHQKSKVDEPKRELSALVKVHESHGSKASAQIKELEGRLTMMKIELDLSRNQKKCLEEQLEKKTTEVKQLREKNSQLKSRVSELELMSKKKGDEISAILKKLKDNESNMASKTKELMTQVSILQVEVESLRAQKRKSELDKKNEVSAQIKGLKERVDAMQQELNSLRSLKNELELQLELKTKEVAEKVVQIESLKEETERNAMAEKVKEHLEVAPEHSVHEGNSKIEELIISKNQETDQLREDKKKLQVKVSELEGTLTEKENEFSNYQKKYEKLKVATKQNRTQVETEIVNLKTKITEQEKILKDRDDAIRKFSEEHKLSKHHSMDFSPKYRSFDSSRLTQHTAERKIEELAERFQMKMENHIRLLYQRILVAEHIQAETKDSYKKAKKKLEDDNRELNAKIEAWEFELEKLSNMLTKPSGINVLTGLDLMARKLDKDNGDFLNRISRISNELQLARNWISDTNNEMKQLQENVSLLEAKLEEKEEKLVKLETTIMSEEAKQNCSSQLESKVEELELKIKEKDEMLLGLGEEKKEAIRQLCFLIEYHRERYDQLKEEIAMANVRMKRST